MKKKTTKINWNWNSCSSIISTLFVFFEFFPKNRYKENKHWLGFSMQFKARQKNLLPENVPHLHYQHGKYEQVCFCVCVFVCVCVRERGYENLIWIGKSINTMNKHTELIQLCATCKLYGCWSGTHASTNTHTHTFKLLWPQGPRQLCVCFRTTTATLIINQ